MPLSPLARQRLNRFRRSKRAWISLWILGIAYVLSLGSEFIANNKPLVMGYEGEVYFPVLVFYPSSEFGGPYGTQANYRQLEQEPRFRENGGWMIWPIVPYSPIESNLDVAGVPPHPPSARHWLGTDGAARDVFARLLYGFRICMSFSLALTLLATAVGMCLGGIQGYAAGKVDLVAQRLVEIWQALPFLYVVILLGAIYGRSFTLLLVVNALFAWIGVSYYARAEFLKLRNRDFVQASRVVGAGHVRLLFRQILPNSWTPVIALLPFMLVSGINTLTALDFLGFGLQPPTPSWGELLSQGLQYLHAPWLAISTVSALFLTLLLTTFVGEGVREAMDPKALSKIR